MRGLYFLLLAIIYLLSSCGFNSKPQIKVITTTVNDTIIKYEIDVKKNVKNGFYKVFNSNNVLLKEMIYSNDTLNGLEKNYFDNAILAREYNWKNGKKNGIEKNYDMTGKLEGEFVLENDKYNGPFKYFYPDGKLKQEGKYVNDAIEGELKTYYQNGNLKEIVSMIATVENGPFVEYYENGYLKAKGTYKYGKEHCILEKFKEDSKNELESKMICSEKGCCTIWDSNKRNLKPSNELCVEIIKEMQDYCK